MKMAAAETFEHEPDVRGEEEEEEDGDEEANTVFVNPDGFTIKHPLLNNWSFWFDNPQAQGRKGQHNWEENLVKIYTVNTVEDFWAVYNNLVTVDKIAEGGNYHFFKENIKPLWEDPQNMKGGKWTAILPKGGQNYSDLWLKTLLLIIGEQFDEHGHEIRGAVFSRRRAGDKLAVWTGNADNREACLAIGRKVYETMKIPLRDFSYQAHLDSARKGSSTTVQSRYNLAQ